MSLTVRIDRLGFECAVREFAELVEKDTKERFEKDGFDSSETGVHYLGAIKTTVKPGVKYFKVDVGTSGRFMVEASTGTIFGIKAYGQVHKGKVYGTLGTVDEYFWGGYVPRRIAGFSNSDGVVKHISLGGGLR